MMEDLIYPNPIALSNGKEGTMDPQSQQYVGSIKKRK